MMSGAYNNGVMADQTMMNLQMNNMALGNGLNQQPLGMGGVGMGMGVEMGMGMGVGMGMGMGVGMAPGLVSNGVLVLSGNCMTIQSYIQNLKKNSQGAQTFAAKITITGNQIKQMNMSCMLATIISGSFIILPLFFMFCAWWTKCVNPAYEVPLSTYQALQGLLISGNLKTLSITVLDNVFNKQKAVFLYDMVSRYNLKGFSLINIAGQNNYNDNQYSDFVKNMKAFKSLPMMTQIRWGSQIVL